MAIWSFIKIVMMIGIRLKEEQQNNVETFFQIN